MGSSVITETNTIVDPGSTAEISADERPPILIAIGATCLAAGLLIFCALCFIALTLPVTGWILSFLLGCTPRLKRLTRLNIALLLTASLALFYCWMNQLSILDGMYCIHITMNDLAFFAGWPYSLILIKQEQLLLKQIRGHETRSN